MDVYGEWKSKHTAAPKEAVLAHTINKSGSQSVAVAIYQNVSFSVCHLLLYMSVHRA